ncbi:MAG: DedA family protein [Syntrophothermus sp.]|nr:DedA family protein [Ignavibacteriaceae bacterium]
MINDLLNYISQLTPFWIYVAIFVFAYIENVFPPSPSDLVVLVAGSLIAKSTINFIPVLLWTSFGSVLGFMSLFYIGSTLDRKVIKTKRLKFISVEALEKAENWFTKYGYLVILLNRFLPGTRSVISFFAGLSELDVKKTIVLSTVSALIWNAIIIYLGYIFGNNVHVIDKHLSLYSNIVVGITVAIVLFFVIRYYINKKKTAK